MSLQPSAVSKSDAVPQPPKSGGWRAVGLIAALLGGALGISALMFRMRPVAPKVEPEIVRVAVEGMRVVPVDHEVQVPSQGAFEPLTETKLAAEVAGRIVAVAPALEAGGSFVEGGVMLEIDPTNYVAAVAQGESTLAEAKLALVSEQARADQAKRDWDRLAPDDKPNESVLRIPQLASAQARVRAAEAGLDKARHDLDRAHVRAPYPCLVKTKQADLGDYVSPGSPLAEVWRSDVFEVRLPVTLDQLSHIDLAAEPEVTLVAAGAGNPVAWKARLVRSEGVVDTAMRSLYLVARLTDPDPAPTPGLFVKASIRGRTLKSVAPVPRKALVDESRVVVIDDHQTLRFRDVRVVWGETEQVLVGEGLVAGDVVCLTAVAAVVEGMPVKVVKIEPSAPAAAAPARPGT